MATTGAAAHKSFDAVVLPHLDAAYRLACWLTRNEHDAEDAVQEASLRALRYFRTFKGGNGRAWFLRIVRNTCWEWRGQSRPAPSAEFDEQRHSEARPERNPEALLLRTADVKLVEDAMNDVPDRFRQVLTLRELKGLSYREVAHVMNVPIGTVMSTLSRARHALRRALTSRNIRARAAISAVREEKTQCVI
jgi:RNA polymerase sigma-70 factor (ECF subfamily)